MMYWTGDLNWFGWTMMSASMLLFWGVIAWIGIGLVRGTSGERSRTPDDTLAERFARGDIDEDEYLRRREALHSPR